jgi:hypothetical protein
LLNERFGVGAAEIITLFIVAVIPGLVAFAILYLVVSVRQLKDAVAWMAWRMGAPAPPQRDNLIPFRRRSG